MAAASLPWKLVGIPPAHIDSVEHLPDAAVPRMRRDGPLVRPLMDVCQHDFNGLERLWDDASRAVMELVGVAADDFDGWDFRVLWSIGDPDADDTEGRDDSLLSFTMWTAHIRDGVLDEHAYAPNNAFVAVLEDAPDTVDALVAPVQDRRFWLTDNLPDAASVRELVRPSATGGDALTFTWVDLHSGADVEVRCPSTSEADDAVAESGFTVEVWQHEGHVNPVQTHACRSLGEAQTLGRTLSLTHGDADVVLCNGNGSVHACYENGMRVPVHVPAEADNPRGAVMDAQRTYVENFNSL